MQKEPGNTGAKESSSHPGSGGGFFPDGGRTSQERPSPPEDTALLRAPALLQRLFFLLSVVVVVVLGTLGLVQVSFHGDLILCLTLSHFGQKLLLNDRNVKGHYMGLKR